jgi:Cu2+-exporting ATPase
MTRPLHGADGAGEDSVQEHSGTGARLDQASCAGHPPAATALAEQVHQGEHQHVARLRYGAAGHGGHAGSGDHAGQFRDRFWWTLLLAVPVVTFSRMFVDLLGYQLPSGTGWISPVLGTIIFCYGGWPFLAGAVAELRARQPGTMLLVTTCSPCHSPPASSPPSDSSYRPRSAPSS